MIVLPGAIGFGALVKQSTGADSGNVTVLAATTTIVDAANLDLALNDVLIVTVSVTIVKGATTGDTKLQVVNAIGGATIRFSNSSGIGEWDFFAEANGTQRNFVATLVGRCLGAGGYTPRLQGTSAGSNSTISAGLGSILAFALRGSN